MQNSSWLIFRPCSYSNAQQLACIVQESSEQSIRRQYVSHRQQASNVYIDARAPRVPSLNAKRVSSGQSNGKLAHLSLNSQLWVEVLTPVSAAQPLRSGANGLVGEAENRMVWWPCKDIAADFRLRAPWYVHDWKQGFTVGVRYGILSPCAHENNPQCVC